MADEIKLTYTAGEANITANVYAPDGTARDTAIALDDTGHAGLYLGDCTSIESGDIIIFYQAGVYLTGQTYEPPDYGTYASGTTGDTLTTRAKFKAYAGVTGTDDDTLIDALITRATATINTYCGRTLASTEYRELYDGCGTTELLLAQRPVTDLTLLARSRYNCFAIRYNGGDAYNAYVKLDDSTLADPVLTIVSQIGAVGDTSNTFTLTRGTYSLGTLATAIEAIAGWEVTVPSAIEDWDAVELLPATQSAQHCNESWTYLDLPYDIEYDYVLHGDTGILYCGKGFPTGHSNIVVRYTAGYATIPADLEQICNDLVKQWYDAKDRDAAVESQKLGDWSYKLKTDAAGLSNDIKLRLTPYTEYAARC